MARAQQGIRSRLKDSGARGGSVGEVFGVGRFAGELQHARWRSGEHRISLRGGEAALGVRGERSNTTLRFSPLGGGVQAIGGRRPASGRRGRRRGRSREKARDDRLQLTNDYLFGNFRLETKAQYQRHALQEVSDDACRLFPSIPERVGALATVAGAAAPKEAASVSISCSTRARSTFWATMLGERVRGTIGVSGIYQTNDSNGPIFLVPDATTTSIGAFIFEDFTRGQWSLLAGGRVDSRKVEADANQRVGIEQRLYRQHGP
jgi:hypothetical protein